jgi:hypothetical protein
LTKKGELALKVGLHRGWKALLPKSLMGSLKRLRSRWYGWQAPEPGNDPASPAAGAVPAGDPSDRKRD